MLWEEIRTTQKTIFRAPHGSRLHGHDRNLTQCVNDPASWKSTPFLKTTECPDEDLSLQSLGPQTYSEPPGVKRSLLTSGVLQIHVCFEYFVQCVYFYSRVIDSCGSGLLNQKNKFFLGNFFFNPLYPLMNTSLFCQVTLKSMTYTSIKFWTKLQG